MTHSKPDRPYLVNWLRRTRKQLAGSGRLTELSLILSREHGDTPEAWNTLIRAILEEETRPSLDLLTQIDAVLAKPVKRGASDEQDDLF